MFENIRDAIRILKKSKEPKPEPEPSKPTIQTLVVDGKEYAQVTDWHVTWRHEAGCGLIELSFLDGSRRSIYGIREYYASAEEIVQPEPGLGNRE